MLGFALEAYFGHGRFLLLYLLSGIGGNLLEAAMNTEAISVGASTSIFGLIALHIAYLKENWSAFTEEQKKNHYIAGGISLLLIIVPSFTSNHIDVIGHFGGFIAGALLSMIYYKQSTESDRRKKLKAAFIIIFVLYFAALFMFLFGLDVRSFDRLSGYCASVLQDSN
eukprot:TRINITY_DN8644_c0_g3_i4.p1 TRINITY_DN8644_c0_g3~~TRINITY_DN8644_c0_g3_i4.p1  ORF type:complete len:168 (-),score=17.89 TRINITY_DN8644_c0_g3_i4:75-578(-)